MGGGRCGTFPPSKSYVFWRRGPNELGSVAQADPQTRPQLIFLDQRKKITAIKRGNDEFGIEKETEQELLDGDQVMLVTGVFVT